MLEAHTPERRVTALDGLRGIFAFLVLCYHYATWFELPIGGLSAFLDRTAIYAVCGFFAISGASMALAYRNRPLTSRQSLLQFFSRRFFRIAPLYYAVLAIHVGGRMLRCISGGTCETGLAADIASNVFFTFGIGRAGENSLVVAGWSIGIEWVFYALFPLLLWFAAKSVRHALALLVLSAAVLATWDLWYIGLGSPGWLTYAQFPAYLVYFAAGMFAGLYRPSRQNVHEKWAIVLIAAYAGLHLVVAPFDVDASIAGTGAWIFGAITCALVLVAAWTRQPMGKTEKVATWAGEVSYAVYLLHFPVSIAIAMIGLSSWQGALVGVVSSVLLAQLSYSFFERPMVKLGNHLTENVFRKPAQELR